MSATLPNFFAVSSLPAAFAASADPSSSEYSTVSNPSSPFVRVAVFSVLGSPAGLPFLPVEAGFSVLGFEEVGFFSVDEPVDIISAAFLGLTPKAFSTAVSVWPYPILSVNFFSPERNFSN